MPTFQQTCAICVLALVIVFCAGAAWGKDSVVAAVSNPLPDPPGAIITENGTHYSRGTFAVGTIQLFYTVTATQFSEGCNHSFTLNLDIENIQNNSSAKPTQYPLVLSLRQAGSPNLVLGPSPSNFNVADSSFTSSSNVAVCVPASVASDPLFQVDGAHLVANLQIEASKGANLSTVTTIQVHLFLVHPTACLKVYDFFANNGITLTGELTTTNPIQVERRTATQNKVTNPTQPKYIVVVANTCSENQCIDGRFTINGDFDLGPGQPVMGFSSNSIIDEYLEVSTFFSGAPAGDPNLDVGTCVTVTDDCIPIEAGSTFLLRVDMNIDAVNAVWPPPAEYTGFSASILNGGSTSNCTVAGTLHAFADPNPLSSSLPAVCNDSGGGNDDCPD